MAFLALTKQFYDHIYSFKLMPEIQKLLDLRKRHRINAVSRVNIQKAEGDIYVAKIDNRVILKLGNRYFVSCLLCVLSFARGQCFKELDERLCCLLIAYVVWMSLKLLALFGFPCADMIWATWFLERIYGN